MSENTKMYRKGFEIEFQVQPKFKKKYMQEVKNCIDAINRHLDTSEFPVKIIVKDLESGVFGKYVPKEKTIYLNPNDGYDGLVHEFGHHLEEHIDDDALKAVQREIAKLPTAKGIDGKYWKTHTELWARMFDQVVRGDQPYMHQGKGAGKYFKEQEVEKMKDGVKDAMNKSMLEEQHMIALADDLMKAMLPKAHKYIKRTGSPGNYRYWYKDPSTGKLVAGDREDQKKGMLDHAKRLAIGGHDDAHIQKHAPVGRALANIKQQLKMRGMKPEDHGYEQHHLEEAGFGEDRQDLQDNPAYKKHNEKHHGKMEFGHPINFEFADEAPAKDKKKKDVHPAEAFDKQMEEEVEADKKKKAGKEKDDNGHNPEHLKFAKQNGFSDKGDHLHRYVTHGSHVIEKQDGGKYRLRSSHAHFGPGESEHDSLPEAVRRSKEVESANDRAMKEKGASEAPKPVEGLSDDHMKRIKELRDPEAQNEILGAVERYSPAAREHIADGMIDRAEKNVWEGGFDKFDIDDDDLKKRGFKKHKVTADGRELWVNAKDGVVFGRQGHYAGVYGNPVKAREFFHDVKDLGAEATPGNNGFGGGISYEEFKDILKGQDKGGKKEKKGERADAANAEMDDLDKDIDKYDLDNVHEHPAVAKYKDYPTPEYAIADLAGAVGSPEKHENNARDYKRRVLEHIARGQGNDENKEYLRHRAKAVLHRVLAAHAGEHHEKQEKKKQEMRDDAQEKVKKIDDLERENEGKFQGDDWHKHPVIEQHLKNLGLEKPKDEKKARAILGVASDDHDNHREDEDWHRQAIDVLKQKQRNAVDNLKHEPVGAAEKYGRHKAKQVYHEAMAKNAQGFKVAREKKAAEDRAEKEAHKNRLIDELKQHFGADKLNKPASPKKEKNAEAPAVEDSAEAEQQMADEKKAPRLKGKKLDDEFHKQFLKHGHGRQINIMDLGKLHDHARKAYEGGRDMESAVKEAIDKHEIKKGLVIRISDEIRKSDAVNSRMSLTINGDNTVKRIDWSERLRKLRARRGGDDGLKVETFKSEGGVKGAAMGGSHKYVGKHQSASGKTEYDYGKGGVTETAGAKSTGAPAPTGQRLGNALAEMKRRNMVHGSYTTGKQLGQADEGSEVASQLVERGINKVRGKINEAANPKKKKESDATKPAHVIRANRNRA